MNLRYEYKSIKKELAEYIISLIDDETLNNDNKEEWHQIAFNQDYYIIYHDAARKWLKNHKYDVFDAIEDVKEYEIDFFGEFLTNINPEAIVNMLAYIYGEELIYKKDHKNIQELKKTLKEYIQQ